MPSPAKDPSDDRTVTLARLSGLLEVTRLVRAGNDLESLLPALAAAAADALGFRTVVVNVYEPAWDELRVAAVHGTEEARAVLMGSRTTRDEWTGLLDPRFERHGCFFLRHGQFDWSADRAPSYVPDLPRTEDPALWHPDDALFVPLRDGDDALLGVISVDEPVSRRRPGDDELHVLAALAAHVAQALEDALAATEAHRHRAALEHLLAVSVRLTETLAVRPILQSVCEAIRAALGFSHVSVELLDPESGRTVPEAAVGWSLEEIARSGIDRAALDRLLDPVYEVEGCYLLPGEVACDRLGVAPGYRTAHNGRGPLAWDHHWLLLPLHATDGTLVGVVWVDEPEDRLLPSRARLQTLRTFANQASTAVAVAAAYAEAQYLAEHDPLTRLGNRRAFTRQLAQQTYRAARYREPFALVVMDVDGFKALNDRHGHAAGDAALGTIGRVLGRTLRLGDHAFRLGGDEFALVLDHSGPAEAELVVDRVCEALDALEMGEGTRLQASFGVAVGDPETADPETLLRAADAAMYEAKRAGERLRVAG
jgi:diguanylate cyclase (GGDEF)-like protein